MAGAAEDLAVAILGVAADVPRVEEDSIPDSTVVGVSTIAEACVSVILPDISPHRRRACRSRGRMSLMDRTAR